MKIQRLCGLIALAFLGAFCRNVEGEIAWEQKTVELQGDGRLPVLEAHFHFTNNGTSPVQIQKVESSCGCTTTALKKLDYNSQEKGEIVAKYTVGTHTGLQKKTILVVANDGLPPTTLTIVAHIQEVLRIAPAVVTWPHKSALTAKHLSLEWLPDVSFDEITVESSNPDILTELVPVIKGRKYDLIVKPRQTEQFALSKLTIRCRSGEQEKTFVAYATVQPGTTGS